LSKEVDKQKIRSKNFDYKSDEEYNNLTISEKIEYTFKRWESDYQRELKPSEKAILEGAVRKEDEGVQVCKTCDGTLWLSEFVGPDVWEKRLTRCPDCIKIDGQKVQEIKYEQANIRVPSPPLLENFDPGIQETARGRKAVKTAYELVKSWTGGEVVMFLCIVGGTGVGKTHLSLSAATKLISNGKGVKYMNGEQFANELRPRSFKDDQGQSQRQFRNDLVNTEYLILDEVGIATDSTGWMSSQYQEIIAHRFDTEKPTLVTGNIEKDANETPENAIERILGSRVVSRLKDTTKSRLCSLWEANDMRPLLKDD